MSDQPYPNKMQVILFVAEQPDANGDVYTTDALKAMADGENYFWDEAQRALIGNFIEGHSGCEIPHKLFEHIGEAPEENFYVNGKLVFFKNDPVGTIRCIPKSPKKRR